jgi:hypothetical protein
VKGCRIGDQLASCTRREAAAALEALAKLHSRWWNHPQLDDSAAWLPRHGDPYFDIARTAIVDAFDPFIEMWGDAIPDETMRIVLADKENMMFTNNGDSDSVAVIDWQIGMRTNPTFDVIYFIAGNFTPAFRRENERDLVEGCHQALMDGGVSDYPIEQCWTDYRVSAIVLLSYSIFSVANIDLDEVNDRGKKLFEAVFDRYMKAIVELESFSLIT